MEPESERVMSVSFKLEFPVHFPLLSGYDLDRILELELNLEQFNHLIGYLGNDLAILGNPALREDFKQTHDGNFTTELFKERARAKAIELFGDNEKRKIFAVEQLAQRVAAAAIELQPELR